MFACKKFEFELEFELEREFHRVVENLFIFALIIEMI
jgi:hypothetical protein